jgi:hypothetical protein
MTKLIILIGSLLLAGCGHGGGSSGPDLCPTFPLAGNTYEDYDIVQKYGNSHALHYTFNKNCTFDAVQTITAPGSISTRDDLLYFTVVNANSFKIDPDVFTFQVLTAADGNQSIQVTKVP